MARNLRSGAALLLSTGDITSSRLLPKPSGRDDMKPRRIAAFALIVAGGLALLLGGFSFTRDTHTARLGELEMTIRDNETVNIPRWLGIAALVAGGLMLFVPTRNG
jgi:hypothetical protein